MCISIVDGVCYCIKPDIISSFLCLICGKRSYFHEEMVENILNELFHKRENEKPHEIQGCQARLKRKLRRQLSLSIAQYYTTINHREGVQIYLRNIGYSIIKTWDNRRDQLVEKYIMPIVKEVINNHYVIDTLETGVVCSTMICPRHYTNECPSQKDLAEKMSAQILNRIDTQNYKNAITRSIALRMTHTIKKIAEHVVHFYYL